MTHEERVIVSAHTGFMMCPFSDVHKYIEEKLGRPVLTHELASFRMEKLIREVTREDFIQLCEREE